MRYCVVRAVESLGIKASSLPNCVVKKMYGSVPGETCAGQLIRGVCGSGFNHFSKSSIASPLSWPKIPIMNVLQHHKGAISHF